MLLQKKILNHLIIFALAFQYASCILFLESIFDNCLIKYDLYYFFSVIIAILNILFWITDSFVYAKNGGSNIETKNSYMRNISLGGLFLVGIILAHYLTI